MDITNPSARQAHGRLPCTACFSPETPLGSSKIVGPWRIDNNPGYWGAPNPEILVLGFSKGANQSMNLPFDHIAFNGARANLREILAALNLIAPDANIDDHFTAAGRTFGFASVIRCGIGLETEPGRYRTSGDVVRKAVEPGSLVREFFDRRTKQYLSRLPASVRSVVFLGLDEPYIEAVYQRMSTFRPAIRRIGPLAYADEEVTFVHVIHPSPLATSHRQKWLYDDRNALALKRAAVTAALGRTSRREPSSADDAPQSISSSIRATSLPTTVHRTTTVPRDDSRLEARAGRALADLLRKRIDSGAFRADEISTPSRSCAVNAKLLRLRRHDGQEFAIDLVVAGCQIWSSAQPSADTSGLEGSETYTEVRTRHSGLNIMPKLRGPDRAKGISGVRAWCVRFLTVGEALRFVTGE